MESSSKVSVPILTDQTFARWKGQIRNVLEADDLLTIVDGVEAMPASASNGGEDRKKWKKRDAKARAILSTSLDDLHDSFCRGEGTSKGMYDKLVSMYEVKSAGRKYTAWQELFDLKWGEDMPAGSFLAKVNAISHKLESLDEKPKDSILIGKVLSGLPAKLESFSQSWKLTKTGADVTFADLQTGIDLPANSKLTFCEGCRYGRMAHKPFKPAVIKAGLPGESIHSDVCGPLPIESIGRKKYILVFKCRHSSFRRVFFIRDRTEVLDRFKDFVNEVEADFGCRRIRRFRSDGAKDYLNKAFDDFLREKGIVREVSPAYTPQSNG